MGLAERLRAVREVEGITLDDVSMSPPTPAPVPARPVTGTDPLLPVRERVSAALAERLGARLFDADLTSEQLSALVVEEVDTLVRELSASLTATERRRLVGDVVDDVMGLGPVQRFIDDPTVSEIMVNGTDTIYVERSGRIEESSSRFVSETHLRQVIDRIVRGVGRRVDEASPMVDARLADGSRVNVILPPLAVDGPVLTIRQFSRRMLGLDDLVEHGALTRNVADLLGAAVRGGMSVLVSGGTGTGKTTMLNLLSGMIPEEERVITIEDAVELQLLQRHVIRLESRPANIEGRGEISIRDLVRNALRMRPDRIVVGEVRGAEALDMLQAMNTGHDGSLATVHANSPRESLSRLETMVLMAGFDLPLRAVREQIASALDLVVQLERGVDGVRRVTAVTEVVGMEGEIITLSDLFTYDSRAAGGSGPGRLVATGVRPGFSDRLAARGIELPAAWFGDDVEPAGRWRTR